MVVMAFDEKRRGDHQRGHQQGNPAALEKLQVAQRDQDEGGQRRAHPVDSDLCLPAGQVRSCHQWRTIPSCESVKVMNTLML